MPQRYFPQNTDDDAGCNASAADGDHDLDKVQGTTTTHTSDVAGVTSYTLVRSYQIDITGDSILTGSQSYDLSISIATLSKCDVRFRIAGIDSGCLPTISGWQEYLVAAGAGVKTFSLTLNLGAGDEDLRIEVEAREESGSHGTRQVILDVQDANTWVDAPTAATAAGPRAIFHG
jgi:hypothetical protein